MNSMLGGKHLAMAPKAQAAIYETEQANKSLRLYTGPIEVIQDNLCEVCDGTVDLEWIPFLSINFHIKECHGIFSTAPCVVNLLSLGVKAKAQISSIGGSSHILGGWFDEELFSIGNSSTPDIKNVVAHVANFTHYRGSPIERETPKTRYKTAGRLPLASSIWNVTIDTLDSTEALLNELDKNRGFAITHVMKIERIDGSVFSGDSASNIMFCLSTFLSFICGYQVSVLLPVGFNSSGTRVWEKWSTTQLEARKHGFSWFPEKTMFLKEISALFYGFAELWNDSDWKNALQLSIYWYLIANEATSSEASVVIYQTALEVIAWYSIVEDRRVCSEAAFNDLSAAQRVTYLLNWAKIPQDIPRSLPGLSALAVSRGWSNGPDVLSKLRNKAVHPTKKNTNTLLTIPHCAMMEAGFLSRWYFELSLLKILNHEGQYVSRINEWTIEDVPWKK